MVTKVPMATNPTNGLVNRIVITVIEVNAVIAVIVAVIAVVAVVGARQSVII